MDIPSVESVHGSTLRRRETMEFEIRQAEGQKEGKKSLAKEVLR